MPKTPSVQYGGIQKSVLGFAVNDKRGKKVAVVNIFWIHY